MKRRPRCKRGLVKTMEVMREMEKEQTIQETQQKRNDNPFYRFYWNAGNLSCNIGLVTIYEYQHT